ncbi:MAG: hypothetical protein ACRDJM_04810, partial [Actinomycetota bacterium]
NLPDHVRRARKRADATEEERALDPNVVVAGPPGWIVKAIQPARATKEYRCPGCNHEIRPGTGHIVAWKPDSEEERRHWHRGCWDSAKKRNR